jgi:hypothetical protein
MNNRGPFTGLFIKLDIILMNPIWTPISPNREKYFKNIARERILIIKPETHCLGMNFKMVEPDSQMFHTKSRGLATHTGLQHQQNSIFIEPDHRLAKRCHQDET